MPDQPPAGLEEPLLETRQGPALDGARQNEPAQQIAEVIGADPEEQSHLVGPKPMARDPGPVGGGRALFDPLPGRSALVVVADDGPMPAGPGRHAAATPRAQ